MRVLISGGAKSGKSSAAQELACRLGGKKYYWATMIPGDPEDEDRIRKHVDYRKDMDFITVECGRNLTEAIAEGTIDRHSTIVFDSITAWAANEMFDKEGCHEMTDRLINDMITVSEYPDHFICTVDDMWRDISYPGWTEKYREGLARVCNVLAERFDTVCEASAGNLHFHKGKM